MSKVVLRWCVGVNQGNEVGGHIALVLGGCWSCLGVEGGG
jgi:hypothetical protein